jgi:hypothetical protein
MAKINKAQAQQQLNSGAKLTQDLIDSLYPEGDKTNYLVSGYAAKARQTLIGLMNKQSQNTPERVGDGGDALEQLYRMIPIRLATRGNTTHGEVYDENAALREQTKNSIFNLEQTAKAEKLKSRKKDKVAFGGKPSTPERKLPMSSTVAAEGTLLGGGSALGSAANNKTLLGG